jgi:VIT1/CCC1 family predicted Fe2+/Mn2+ transporter
VGTETAGATPPEIHHSHRNVTGGWLRPAVFGVMDGLVSNFALIAGVAGGGVAPSTIVLTGLAGLAAGAFSMATGEYVSVSSQSELAHAEIEVERREIAGRPEAEESELALLYRRRGLAPDLAAEVARQLSANPDEVWRVHAREELGIDPDDLPSGVSAAASSFAAFAVGALLPVVPYLLGAQSLLPALVVAALGLFLTGVLVARFTARPWWHGGGRQLLLGGLAAMVTYAVGALVGTTLG